MDLHKTPVERFNEADEEEQRKLAEVMLKADIRDPVVKGMVEKRRRNYAETLSAGDNLDLETVEELIEEREDDFIEDYGRDENEELLLPEWFLRIEAQDVLMESIHHRLYEENLL